MDVLAANITVENAKTPKSGNAGKLGGSISKNKNQVSFADYLHSAAQPKRTQGEAELKADERNNNDQSARTNGEVIPLFNTVTVMPVTLGDSDADVRGNIKTSADTMLNQLGEADLNKNGGQANPILFQGASRSVPSSDGNQPIHNNTQDVSNLALLGEHAEQRQLSSITKVDMLPDSNLNAITNETNGINKQNHSNQLSSPNSDNRLNQETVKTVEQLLAVHSKSVHENLLKPLETAAYQNVSLVPINNEANKSLQVDEAVQTADMPAKESKISLNTVIAAPLTTSSEQETTNAGILLDQNLSEIQAVENATDKPGQSFLQILNQTSRNNQADTIDGAGQSIPQPPQDTNNVVGQIVEHARLIKNSDMSEMVIKLKPEHLGELTLKVAVDNGVVSASFHTNNSEVRGIIEASMQQLRQDMAQQGLKVEYVGVYAGLGQPFSNGQGEANRQQAWKSQTTKKSGSDEFSDNLETIENAGIVSSDTGVDYRI